MGPIRLSRGSPNEWRGGTSAPPIPILVEMLERSVNFFGGMDFFGMSLGDGVGV